MFRNKMNITDIPQTGLVYRFTIGDYHYTGSTLETIHHRVRTHQSAYKGGGDGHTRKLYKHLMDNGGWDTVKVLILERDVEEDKLKQREQSYINKDDPFCLNTYNVIASLVPVVKSKIIRTDAKKAYDVAYYEAHKEEMKRLRMERYKRDMANPARKERMLEVARQATARYNAKKKGGVDV